MDTGREKRIDFSAASARASSAPVALLFADALRRFAIAALLVGLAVYDWSMFAKG